MAQVTCEAQAPAWDPRLHPSPNTVTAMVAWLLLILMLAKRAKGSPVGCIPLDISFPQVMHTYWPSFGTNGTEEGLWPCPAHGNPRTPHRGWRSTLWKPTSWTESKYTHTPIQQCLTDPEVRIRTVSTSQSSPIKAETTWNLPRLLSSMDYYSHQFQQLAPKPTEGKARTRPL